MSSNKNNMTLTAAIKTYITDSINEIITDKKITKKITDLFEDADFNSKLASTIASNIPKTTAKPKRDENKPKKPSSTYLRFSKDNRAAVLKDLTKKLKGDDKLKNTDTLKGIAEAWGKYKTAAESKPKGKEAIQIAAWEAEIKKEKLVYEEEMKEYVPPPGTSSGRKGGPAKTDPALPTRAPSAYLLFSKEHRAEVLAANPDVKGKEMTSLLAKAWGEFKAKVEEGDADAKKEMNGYLSVVKDAKDEFAEKMKSYKPTEGYSVKGRLLKEGDDKKSAKKPAKKSKKDEETDDEPEEEEEEEKPKSSSKKVVKKVVKKVESEDEDEAVESDAEELEDE